MAVETPNEDNNNQSGNKQVPVQAGNPRFRPGLDPDPNPKVVVRAINPPITPDQVVSQAESPSATTLPDVKLEKIRIPRVQNKSIQGYLKAIEAKMTATEKLMKDVVKLQNLQIVTEKELHERKRELYQNTFEEYLLDKTVGFDDKDDPDCTCINIPKKPGGGFPFAGGRRRRRGPGGGGIPPVTFPPAENEAENENEAGSDAGEVLGTRDFGDNYAQKEREAINKVEEFRRQQEQKTKVRPPGDLPLKEGEEEAAEPKTPVLPEQDPAFVPAPIKPPTPNQDPADIETDIEALKYLYEQQPTFTGGLVGNMIPPNTMVHERADGYMVLVSPHARQNAEAPNPFVNGGKVRVLPPTVTVLRPEDVAALQSSDAAKAANTLQLYMAVQDVLAAMYGLKTRNGRTPKAGTVPYGRVSQPRMRDAINTIKRRRNNTTPVAPVEAKTPVTAKGARLGGDRRIMKQSRPVSPKEAQMQVNRDMMEAEMLAQDPAFIRMLMDQGFDFSAGSNVMPRTRKVFQSKRQPGVSFETNMDISDFMGSGGGFGPRPLTFKEELLQMKQPSFDQYSSPIGPMPKASGGVGEMNLYDSKSKQYFRNISNNMDIPKFADGGFMGWFNKGVNTRIPNESTARFGNPLDYFKKNPDPTTLFGDDALQRGQSNKNFKAGKKPSLFGRPDRAFGLDLVDSVKQRKFVTVPASQGGPMSGPTPVTRELVKRPIRAARSAVKPGHPLVMLAELIINELISPQSTAVYDQVTGPNAYYNDPAYKGPMPSQNLENAQSNMMSGNNDQKPEVVPLPPDYIKIPGRKKDKSEVGYDAPGIDIEASPFARRDTAYDPGFGVF